MVSNNIIDVLYNPRNKDGSVRTDDLEYVKIFNNKNKQQVSSDQTLALLANKDKTVFNIGFLNQDKEVADQELSRIEYQDKLESMPAAVKKVASDAAFWKAIYDNTDDSRKVNKVWENKLEYQRSGFLNKVYYDTLYQNKMHDVYALSAEINKIQREGGDATEVINQRNALRAEAETMAHAPKQSIASATGSFASSMWQTKETIAAQAATGMFLGGLAGATVGAVGGYFQTAEIERNAMLDALEDVEGLTAQDRYDIADKYATYSAVIEMAGWNLGVGRMTSGLARGIKDLIAKEGKEGATALVKKMATKEGFLGAMKNIAKETALTSANEATEEVVQNEAADVIKTLNPEEIRKMGVKENIELSKAIVKKTADTAADIAHSIIFGEKMSEHAQEQLQTWLYTFAGSAVFGGPSATVSIGGRTVRHNDIAERVEKTGLTNLFEGQENLRKTTVAKEAFATALSKKSPKAFDEIFRRIAEANSADGKVYINAESLGKAINNIEDEELKASFADIQSAVDNAVDGTVELDYATAKVLFTDEAEQVYNQIVGDIAWDSETMSPNDAVIKFSNGISDKVSGVASEKIAELEEKLLSSMQRQGAKEKQLAHANAVMALHAANALHNANPERSLNYYLTEVVDNFVVGATVIEDDEKLNSMVGRKSNLSEENARPYFNKQVEKFLQNPQENEETLLDLYDNHWEKYGANIKARIRAAVVYDLQKRDFRQTEEEKKKAKREAVRTEQANLKLPKKISLSALSKVIKDNGYPIVKQYTANTGSQYITVEVDSATQDEIEISIRDHAKHSNDYVRPDYDLNIEYDNNWQEDFERLADKLDLKGALVTKVKKYNELSRSLESGEEQGEVSNSTPKNAYSFYKRLYSEIENKKASKQEKLIDTPMAKTQNTSDSKFFDKYVAGTFDPTTLEIRLTSASNPTTFAHELMHYFMSNMVSIYNSGNMVEEWKATFEKAMTWAGEEKDANGMYSFDTADVKVRMAQEKLAEGFTSYLLKGEAPSQATRGLFRTLKTWFKAVYAMLKMRKIRLNKDVTTFYDKIFSVDGDVELLATQEKLGMMDKPANVSDEQWTAYQQAKEEAKDVANSQALKIIAKRTKIQSEQAYKEVFDRFFNEKMEELKEDPAYQARTEMLRVKVNQESVNRVAGDVKLDKRFIATDKEISDSQSDVIGEDIAVIANKYGFGDNILDFIDWINNADSEKVTADEYARERADAWIDEQYPELREVSAEHALRNIAAMKVNIYEYMILRKIPFNQFNMIFDEMTKSVESVCAEMSAKELANSEKLERRLRSIMNKIISLQNTNSTSGLATLKYRAAMLNYMIDISKAVRTKRIRFAKKFNKYRKFPSNANLRTIDGQAWNLVLDILNKHGMTARHTATPDIEARLSEFINYVLDTGYSDIKSLEDHLDVLTNIRGTNANTMPFGEFIVLDESLRDIEAAGKELVNLIAENDKIAMDEAEKQIIDYAQEHKIRTRSSEDKGINKLKNWWMNGVSIMETQLAELMPKELFNKYILPFFDGMNLAVEWKNDTSKRLLDIMAPVLKKQSRLINVAGHQFTVLEGLVIMLNAGNEHNIKCIQRTLLEKKGIETDINQIIQELPEAIAATGVEADVRDVVQQVWDIFEETAPAMKAAQKLLNGREVNLIKPQSITFADGKTIKGGYYPARGSDYTGNERNVKDTSNFIQKTFSFTLDRTGQIHGNLPLDLTMLTSWVGQISKLMYVAVPANNIMKIAGSKKIEAVWGDERIKTVKEWLSMSISPERIDPIIAKISSFGSILILGGNIAKVFVQALGFSAAIAYTGFQVIPSLIKCLNPVSWRNTYKFATSKSVYMRNRYNDPLNHLYNSKSIESMFSGAISKGYDKAAQLFMSAVTLGDNFASTVVWDAVYKNSISEGMSEHDAVLNADSAVRRTQGDTSHGSRPKAIQGWKRLLSPFCSYFLAVHNIITAKMQHGDKKAITQATVMLATYGITVPYIEAIMSSFVNYYGYSDEERRKKRIKNLAEFKRDSQIENMVNSTFNILLPIGGLGSYPSAVALKALGQQSFLNPTVVPHEPIIRLTKVIQSGVDTLQGKESADIMKEVEKLIGADKMIRSGRFIEALITGNLR